MNTFWVHKNWKWKKENATAKYIDEHCEEAVTLTDALATVEALQARVKELEQVAISHDQSMTYVNGQWSRAQKKLTTVQAALDAERAAAEDVYYGLQVMNTPDYNMREADTERDIQAILTLIRKTRQEALRDVLSDLDSLHWKDHWYADQLRRKINERLL